MGGNSFVEKLLFTHKGFSGPAVLQASSFWRPDRPDPLVLDLLPHKSEGDVYGWLCDLRQNVPGKQLRRALKEFFPMRFATLFWAAKAAPQLGVWHSAKFEHLSDDALRRLACMLKHWEVEVGGTEGYPKAEVTCGGVSTQELNAETLESKRRRGLFFVGEAVDVTGWLGGYNFQWAWASGYAAGLAC